MKTSRIFIMPTGFGTGFILGAALMILIGASYQNNLVNLLAFFMLSLVFIGMIQTHLNLKDVSLSSLDVENGFAGGEFVTTFVLASAADEPRYNLEAGLRREKTKFVYENVLPLAPRSTLKLRASYVCTKRGVFRTKQVKVFTEYPLGLFHSWILIDAPARYFVYPKPTGARPLPTAVGASNLGVAQLAKGGDDFYGHRKYQLGDSSRQVDWKAHARGRSLLVKEFSEGFESSYHFEWSALADLGVEERLSQLSAWVDEAKLRKVPFTLRLPGAALGPAAGEVHARRCLEALASYTEGGAHAPPR